MLEEVEQAFLAHQPLDKRKVAFLILRGKAALGITARIAEIKAPVRNQTSFAVVSLKYRFQDIDHGLILENSAVTAEFHERSPRLDHQPVTGQAAVCPDQLGASNMPVERPQS